MSKANSSPNDGRKAIRYSASWRVAVAIEGQPLREGRTKDISSDGLAILYPQNLRSGVTITMHILIPPLTTDEQRIIIVRGLTCNTVHDSNHHCFRVGVSFEHFETEADREFLRKRLENSHKAVMF